MSKEPSIPADILQQISNGANNVRNAGEALTKRIKGFEAWLGKLPGRVEAACDVRWDEAGVIGTYLSFERDGKDWALYTYEHHQAFDDITNRKLLRDASIKEKSWMIEHFPALLKAIVEAQKSIVDRARESANTFDVFAKSIGLTEGE